MLCSTNHSSFITIIVMQSIVIIIIRLQPIFTLFPYTTLFRSHLDAVLDGRQAQRLWSLPARCPVDEQLGVRGLAGHFRSEEHTSELQSQSKLVCRLLLEKKKNNKNHTTTIIKIDTQIITINIK